MTRFSIQAEVLEGDRETGQNLSACVAATDRLDAVIRGEQLLDATLPRSKRHVQWCHVTRVVPLTSKPLAVALAA